MAKNPHGIIGQYQTLNDWKVGGGNSDTASGTSVSIQSSDVHEGDGSNALEVTSVYSNGFWKIRVYNTSYAFDGDGINDINVTVSFWVKTTDTGSDVIYGNTSGGFRLLLKPLSKLKAVSQDLYTAEDDFWKIASWAMEKSRLEKTLTNAGLTRGKTFIRNGVEEVFDDNFLKREAADIVKY